MLLGTGLTKDDLDKPQVGIASMWYDGNTCNIEMTLTSQACPEARTIPEVMKRRVNAMDGIESTEINIVWEPQWTPQKISAEGRKILGIEEE